MRIITDSKQQKGGFFMEQIAIFCDTDDFCRAYEEYCRNKLLMDKEEVVPRTRMSLSKIMTILINVSSTEKISQAGIKSPLSFLILICRRAF